MLLSRTRYLLWLLVMIVTLAWHPVTRAEDLSKQLEHNPNAALLIRTASGRVLTSVHADRPLVPASTLKLLTALAALEHWGPEHRFVTDFYLHGGTLFIQGHGDPFLISEEIDAIADELVAAGLPEPVTLALDDRWMAPGLHIDGQSRSENPYDAPAGAIAANFNTIYLNKSRQTVTSAEPQTPVTAITRKIAATLRPGKQRVNIPDAHDGARHFAGILRHKLMQRHIHVTAPVTFAPTPDAATRLLRHENQHELEQVVRAMLKFSTNFIANQLFLMLGAEALGTPATIEKSQHALQAFARQRFGWSNIDLREGAGLSRHNHLSARQLDQLLQRFQPWRDLLPHKPGGLIGKTGTLKGVGCFAGYLSDRHDAPSIVLMLNDDALASRRDRILRQLTRIYRPTVKKRRLMSLTE